MQYLVELFASRRHDADAGELAAELARAARAVGDDVTYLQAILVPEDETCLLLYEASSADSIAEAARRAGIEYERIVPAVGAVGAGGGVS